MSDTTLPKRPPDVEFKALVVQPTHQNRNTAYIDIAAAETQTIIVFAILAGAARYLYGISKAGSAPFRFLTFVAECLISVVAAFIAANLAAYVGVINPNAQIAIIGLSGYAGVHALNFIQEVVQTYIVNKLGFNKPAIKKEETPPNI